MPDPVITQMVTNMDYPSAALRRSATQADPTEANHTAFLEDWPCLNVVEAQPAQGSLPLPRTLTVAAWNIERCKRVEDSADLLRQVGADVVLATELDIGMARSGQRHTVRDLAAELGFAYAFGTEFVELGTGDPYETELFSEVANLHGLHGNAILSRFPLIDPRVLRLETTGAWYTSAPKADGQRRVGGRNAVLAEVSTAFGRVTFAAVHFESQSDAQGRKLQTERLLEGLSAPLSVVGGDLNTADLTGRSSAERLLQPEQSEPCFGSFAEAGFDWRTANTGAVTTRAAPGRAVRYPLKTLDWLFVRGVAAMRPAVHAAVSDEGNYLSDHELIVTTICERPQS